MAGGGEGDGERPSSYRNAAAAACSVPVSVFGRDGEVDNDADDDVSDEEEEGVGGDDGEAGRDDVDADDAPDAKRGE